jgi:hypothetical protein
MEVIPSVILNLTEKKTVKIDVQILNRNIDYQSLNFIQLQYEFPFICNLDL